MGQWVYARRFSDANTSFQSVCSVMPVKRPGWAGYQTFLFSSLLGFPPGGSFSFDNSTLTGVGKEELTPINGGAVSVSFTFEGTTYVTGDDSGFSAFPEVTFEDGVLLGLSFCIADNFCLGSYDAGYFDGGIDFQYVGSETFLSLDAVTYSLVTQEVPEPMTLALLGAGLAGLGFTHCKPRA
jgi:hypothetical protein